MERQENIKEERSLGDLFSELAGETSTLVREEVALAQQEIAQKAVIAGKSVGSLVIGGAVAYAAMLAILTAAIAGLSSFIPVWLAALVVGIVVGIVAFMLISPALAALKKLELAPRETVKTLKEDAQWLKKQMS